MQVENSDPTGNCSNSSFQSCPCRDRPCGERDNRGRFGEVRRAVDQYTVDLTLFDRRNSLDKTGTTKGPLHETAKATSSASSLLAIVSKRTQEAFPLYKAAFK